MNEETRETYEEELLRLQVENQRIQNAILLSNHTSVSLLYLLKRDIGWTDDELKENEAWLMREFKVSFANNQTLACG
jgi:hypothetical protein